MNTLAILAISGGVLLIYCGLKDQSPLHVLGGLVRGTGSALKVTGGSSSGPATPYTAGGHRL